jgi:rod shape determining protein RodA
MAARFFSHIDRPLLIAVAVLIAASLLALASSGGELLGRQIIWLVPSVLALVLLPQANIKAMLSYRWVIYGFYTVLLCILAITYFIAPTISGARSWIQLGAFQIQPSEFMKAALILLFSSFFAVRHVAIARVRIILNSFVYFLIPASLILMQPDLGTTLVIFGIWFGYLLLSEIKLKHLAIAFLILIAIAAAGWGFALENYQKARVIALFSPEADPLGVNYSVIQSRIAIGSGGLYGNGFGQGTQAHLGFLPAAHTDFIFSTFVEEWGLLGGLVVIGAFLYLVLRLISLGRQSDNNFSKFVALGTALMLMIHFVINLGSATGLLPVIGIGLPFVSYGGSNLLTASLLVGIVQGLAEKRARA